MCVPAGARGVSVPHHFYGGGIPEGNSLRPALPSQRLPEERLESAGLHHRSRGVSSHSCERFSSTVRSESVQFDRGSESSIIVKSLPGNFLKALPDTFLHISTSSPD